MALLEKITESFNKQYKETNKQLYKQNCGPFSASSQLSEYFFFQKQKRYPKQNKKHKQICIPSPASDFSTAL